jgi:hypothetical protein
LIPDKPDRRVAKFENIEEKKIEAPFLEGALDGRVAGWLVAEFPWLNLGAPPAAQVRFVLESPEVEVKCGFHGWG